MTLAFHSQIEVDELRALLETEFVNINDYRYRPIDPIWRLTNNSKLHIQMDSISEIFPIEKRPYFRIALAHYAKGRSGSTVSNVCQALWFVHKSFPNEDMLSEAGFLSIRAGTRKSHEWRLSTIRGFFRYWHNIGYWGVSKEFLASIADMRLESNSKFTAIRNSDPHIGPYSPLESQAIFDCMNNALSAGTIDLTDYFSVYLLLTTAQRPVQLAALRFSDFYRRNNKFYVNVPEAKGRGVPFRGRFTEHEIPEDVHIAMRLHRQRVYDEMGEGAESLDLPVFPNYGEFRRSPVSTQAELTIDHYLPSTSLSDACTRVEREIQARSERTGETIHLTPKRFRSTMGTDMAREGYGAAVIAAKLGHADLQHVGAYVESQPEFAELINKAVGSMLAPLAQAFAGTLIRDEGEAVRGNDPASRIRTVDGSKTVGNCGSYGFCGVNAPVGCYTCNRFQPWVDAPHHEVMDALLEERQRILDVTGDKTIAAQSDRSILAVADVIQQCSDLKGAQA
ncbi:site-specific integrase [Marinobacter manganoxydans]|uniref:Phage integrase n=1 Tax=Marinobacter manganoxydans MnI7-9 TaxID=1094979 RepID=G6YUA0_9GAMM|nr:site-specific integrase [Marinobacter manganoxydans]EHJ04230.1 Phage integrase [Marinobacter manganoxydans MnI7-9]